MASSNAGRVAVAVRIRPVLRTGGSAMHQQERFELVAARRTGDNTLTLHDEKPDETSRTSVFTFDYVFDQEATQLDVYEDSVVELVDGALMGQNATVMAYGQTGSGKTHSVLGDVKPNPLENDLLTPQSGLFLRVLSDLLLYKAKVAYKLHVVVLLTCVEIYNEQIRDLFGGAPVGGAGTGGMPLPPPPAVKVVMTDELVYMPSVTIKEMSSLQAVFGEIQLAISRRSSRSTESNASSSRSHCLFLIDVMQRSVSSSPPTLEQFLQFSQQEVNNNGGVGPMKPFGQQGSFSSNPTVGRSGTPLPAGGDNTDPTNGALPGFVGSIWPVAGEDPILGSKIVIADLAGSEKISKSGVTGQGLAEATSINSSLTALGNVVHSLYEGGFVSYRVSNLTRLLKPSFSHPHGKVLLLSQIAPTQYTFDESLSTLHFANKVKAMKVVTTKGVDVERLQVHFLEAEKMIESILADLRICAVEQRLLHGPLQRRCEAFKGVSHPYNIVQNYSAVEKKRPVDAKERRQMLQDCGVLEAVRQAKALNDAAVIRQEEEEQNQLRLLRTRLVSDEWMSYHTIRKELERSLQHEISEALEWALQDIITAASVEGMEIHTTEELEWTSLMKAASEEHRSLLQAQLELVDAQYESVSRIPLPAVITTPTASGAAAMITDPEQLQEDTQYALSTWGHCSGFRFRCKYLDVREAQTAVYAAQCNVYMLVEWCQKVGIPSVLVAKAAASAAAAANAVPAPLP